MGEQKKLEAVGLLICLVFPASVLICIVAGVLILSPRNHSRNSDQSDLVPVSPLVSGSSVASGRAIPDPVTKMKTEEPCQIVEKFSADLPGLKRTAIKVIIGQPVEDLGVIRSRLIEAAQKQEADVVLAYGYFQGEDWHTFFPAGILEYGKNGRGWMPDSKVPLKGAFKSRADQMVNLRRGSSPNAVARSIEDAASAYVAAEPPDKTAEEKNLEALTGMLSRHSGVSEQSVRSMSRYEQGRLALKWFADTVGVSEEQVLRMSDAERAEAFKRHISSKYGVSESDVGSAWQMLEKN